MYVILEAVLVLTILLGCSVEKTPISKCDLPYEIIKENGISYLDLDDNSSETKIEDTAGDAAGSFVGYSISFESPGELINDIKLGNFTEDELEALNHFPTDALGRVQVCNLEKFIVPSVPSSIELKHIFWNGTYFMHVLRGKDNDTVCHMKTFTYDQYEEEVDLAKNFHTRTTCKVHSVVTEEDRNATVTRFTNLLDKECKRIYYTITVGDKTLHISENYTLGDTADVLDNVQICGSDNGEYFYYMLDSLSERPSVEWLSKFGLREYVETEVA
jgi:hypothetical protein